MSFTAVPSGGETDTVNAAVVVPVRVKRRSPGVPPSVTLVMAVNVTNVPAVAVQLAVLVPATTVSGLPKAGVRV